MCNDLLGPLPSGAEKHPLCAWATPDDWRALRPWLRAELQGAPISGSG